MIGGLELLVGYLHAGPLMWNSIMGNDNGMRQAKQRLAQIKVKIYAASYLRMIRSILDLGFASLKSRRSILRRFGLELLGDVTQEYL